MLILPGGEGGSGREAAADRSVQHGAGAAEDGGREAAHCRTRCFFTTIFTTILTTMYVALQKMEDEKQRVAVLGACFTSTKVQILRY